MNVAITLDGSGSSDPDGTVTAWWWQFGDGGSTTVGTPTVSHTYTAVGTYSVTLWVRDNLGTWSATSDSATVTIGTSTTTPTTAPPTTTTSSSTTTTRPTTTSAPTASTTSTSRPTTTSTTKPNVPPTANAGPDQLSQTLVTLTFNGSASDSDGTIALASWTFGDGASASGLVVTHSYAAAGTYTATLTVVDNGGASASDSATVTITNRPPVANAGPNENGPTNTMIGLNGSQSSDPDGTIVTYAWAFGDGATGTGAMPSHAYGAPGTYTATLTVTDNNGANSAANTTVTVNSPTWAKSMGSLDTDAGYAVAADAAGNTFVGGAFHGSMDLGSNTTLNSAGGSDWFLAKYSPFGGLLWARSMGGTGDDYLDALAVDGNGDVVTCGRFAGTASFGGTTSLVANGTMDMAVAKYSGATGAHSWSKGFGGAYDDAASAIAVDGTNNVYFTGYFRGTVDFGGGPLSVPYDTDLDVFVTKLTSAGAHVWSKHFTNTGNERGYGIAADANGNVAITGYFSNSIDFGGGTLTSLNAMVDIFVARFTSTGAHSWSKSFGSPTGNESGYAAAMDASGNVVIAGYAVNDVDFGGGTLSALGSADAFVAKYTAATGAHMWSRRMGGLGNDYAYGVAVDASGNVYVDGSFDQLASFGGASLVPLGLSDAFVAKYGPTGTPAWVKDLGGIDTDVARAIGISAGYPVATGYFFGVGGYNGSTLTSLGVADAFLVRLAP